MSTSGLTNQYDPPTLDGLTILDADAIYINGQEVNLDSLVPYSGATQAVDLGVFPLRTAYLAAGGSDVVNKDRLDLAINNVINSVGANFLSKTIGTDQSVVSKVSFLSDLVVSPQKQVDLAEQVVVDANYQNLITSASVTVGQYFGSISNVGIVYQATCTNNIQPILTLASIVTGKRYRILIETLIQDSTYDWSLDIYQSQNGVDPYPNFNDGLLDTNNYAPASVLFQLSDVTFTALTSGTIALTILTTNPSGVGTVQWKNLKVFEMGVSLQNVTMPLLTGDRVMVLNDKKQLVASGINTTKLGYLDNVSSDIQTQINTKASTSYVDNGLALKANLAGGNSFTGQQNYSDKTLNTVAIFDASKNLSSSAISTTELNYLSGVSSNIQTQLGGKLSLTGGTMTGSVAMNGNKITTSYTPTNAEDLTRKGYVDSAISGAVGNYVLKAGDTMTGNLSINGGDFRAYRAGDTNKGCVLFGRNEDGASFSSYNGGLGSWYGIGFKSTLDEITRFIFNTRDGTSEQIGSHNISVASETAPFHIYTSSANHYNSNPSTTYLLSGLSGYLTVANKTSRTDTDACLMYGTNSDISEVTSVTTDGTDLMPLNFGGNQFNFVGGNVGIGQTAPWGALHFANAVSRRKLVLYQVVNNAYEWYGLGILANTFLLSIDQTASSFSFVTGTSTTTSAELMSIKGTGQLGFYGGGTGYAIPNSLMTKPGSVSFGSIGENYGGGWQAGMMLECQNTTEFSCHDSGNRLTSFIYYNGANNITIGRDIGWGVTPVTFSSTIDATGADIRRNTRTGTHGSGMALYVTKDSGDYSDGIAEFRHSNGTQGIGIGYNGIYACGTNSTQRLNIVSKGNDGIGFITDSLLRCFIHGNGRFHAFEKLSVANQTDPAGRFCVGNPNGSISFLGYTDNSNYIRGINTTFDTEVYFNGTPKVDTVRTITWRLGLDDFALNRALWTPLSFLKLYTSPAPSNFINWNGLSVGNVMNLPIKCNLLIQGFATFFADAGGRRYAYARLYHQATGVYYYPEFAKYFNLGSNHEVVPINSFFYNMPAGLYDMYCFVGGNVYVDANDKLELSAIVFT